SADIIQTRSGTGNATSATFTERVEDDTSYEVWVRVADGYGMWSDWTVAGFDVDYALPPQPTAEAVWYPDEGYAAITVDAPASASGEVPLDTISVYRLTTEARVLVAQGLAPGDTVTDMIPPLNTAVTYEAVALSALPSER